LSFSVHLICWNLHARQILPFTWRTESDVHPFGRLQETRNRVLGCRQLASQWRKIIIAFYSRYCIADTNSISVVSWLAIGSTFIGQNDAINRPSQFTFLKCLCLIICYGKIDSNVYSLALSQRDTTVILFTDELYEIFKNGFTFCSDVELVDLFAFYTDVITINFFKSVTKMPINIKFWGIFSIDIKL